jgi:putative tricarboxylic transport membrane protein
MSSFDNLLMGFSIVLTAKNFLFCFLGCLMGTLVGVLPGLGPMASIALLMTTTIYMHPITGIIMLAGIYYGAMYGGSTTSILVNMPGESASVVTCLDGYQMARQGRAGPALGISAFGSFFAGTIGTLLLMFLAPPLATVALSIGPPEFCCLMFTGFMLLVYLAHGSMLKALMMCAIGVIMSTVGDDIITGMPRFDFGIIRLRDGLGLLPVVMGLFGIGEVLIQLEEIVDQKAEAIKTTLRQLLPNKKDWRESTPPILRGTVLGFLLGIIPGGGALIASFSSYTLEKKLSRNPEEFGRGTIKGVAGPETANNAGTSGAFVPLLTLGIPSNPVMALLLGALMMHGVRPGPLMLQENPDVFWAIIASMYIGNAMLLILNLPLIGLWVKVLKVPYQYLFPIILLLCVIGVYSVSYNFFDIGVLIFFGIVGYIFRKCEFEPAPLVLALVLGPMFETALRQSLIIFDGNALLFFTRPISAVFIGICLLIVVTAIMSWARGRTRIFSEDAIEQKELGAK